MFQPPSVYWSVRLLAMGRAAASRLVWDGETISPQEYVYRLVATLMRHRARTSINGNPLGSVELHWAPTSRSVSVTVRATFRWDEPDPPECPPPPSLGAREHDRQRRLG